MGLLEILNQKNERREELKNSRAEASVERTAPPGRNPIPCEICLSPFFWIDIYGAVRCCDCQPAPSMSLVRWPLWGLAGPGAGPWVWEPLDGAWRRLGGDSGDAAASGGDSSGVAEAEEVAEVAKVKHEFHGRHLLTMAGGDSVAFWRDKWAKCVVFCWQ